MQLMQLKSSQSPAASIRGFTLIEVLVALIITAIGLLGLAKIQALVFANTGSASARSMVAMQAAGLASAMHANRSYWVLGPPPASLTINGTTISDATLAATATGTCPVGGVPTLCDCMFGGALAPCSPASMAAFDLHTWANALNAMLPGSNPSTLISCPPGISPLNCTISITWNEKTVSLNAESAAGTTAGTTGTFAPNYTLYVEP
jgi:type IV pilus assembly protein PilV